MESRAEAPYYEEQVHRVAGRVRVNDLVGRGNPTYAMRAGGVAGRVRVNHLVGRGDPIYDLAHW